jgi:hypothetical protein
VCSSPAAEGKCSGSNQTAQAGARVRNMRLLCNFRESFLQDQSQLRLFSMLRTSILLLAIGLIVIPQSVKAQDSEAARELENYWSMVERTVVEGDYAGMVASYHPDAVTVSLNGESATIGKVLDGMTEDKEKDALIKAGIITRKIEFDVMEKVHGESSAMEKGWFHYWYQEPDQEMTHTYGTMEAYFVKLETWIIVAEKIDWSKTEQEWNERSNN